MRTMVESLNLPEPSKLWVDLTPKVGFNSIEVITMLSNMTRVLSKEKNSRDTRWKPASVFVLTSL